MLFLSHSGADTEEAKSLASLLRQAGLEVWLDVERLQPGNRWMEELETALWDADGFAVYVGQSGVQRWVDREVRVALERNTQNPEFRVFPILGPGANPSALPLFLKQHQRLDLSAGFSSSPAQIKGLISALLEVPSERVALLPPGKPPFLGLQAFDVEDALLFYGRDREIEELLHRLQKQRFLAVIGDSGSGKSSLVRAGLIPSLLRGRFQDGPRWAESWRVAILRPADDPFRELANALPDLDAYGQVRNDVRRACERDLREGTTGLYNCVASLVKPGDRTLILVDQFEELFTLGRQTEREEDKRTIRDQQNRFIDCLFTAADTGGDRPVYVVLTLRADFYAQCWQHDQLPRRIAANQYAVQRIPTGKLREVIETPLSLAGAKAEPGLVRTILEDMGEAPGSLPLLEHALELLWDARTDHTLTHAAYESLGRLKGAIRNYADKVYRELLPAEQTIAEKILLRLTQLGEGTEDTRRTARVKELVSIGSDPGLTQEVLKRLADARLVTVSGDIASTQAGGNDTTVDIAHETLIREWPELRSWIEKNQDAIRTARRLEAAAREWKQADEGARSDYLYRGARLAEALEWAGKQDRIPDDIREFLEAGEIPLFLVRAKAEPGLVRTILEDIGDAPSKAPEILPLLEQALELLWDARTDHTLTHAAYKSFGGLRGAIRNYADKVYRELLPAEQTIAEKILLRLTQLGEGTEDTRRTARVKELVSIGSDPGLTQEVLKRLADARLVTVRGTNVYITHEGLIHWWPKLQNWIQLNWVTIRIARRLEAAAREWKQAGEEARSDYLYRGARLAEALKWAGNQDRIPDDVREFLSDDVHEFLEASEAALQREITRYEELRELAEARAKVEEQLRQEADRRRLAEEASAEQARHSAVRSRRLSYALAGLFLFAVGAAIFARCSN